MIVTIAREHGSAGREIARKLAEEINYNCYDKEIVDAAAENSSMNKELIDSYDEKRVSPFMIQTTQYSGLNYGFGLNIEVASAQFDAIRALSENGNCIFVGRCADYILRARTDIVRVFIRGEMPEKIECIVNRQGVSEDSAKKKIKEVDKDRASYYKYFTDQVWGDITNYDICINSSKLGVDGSVAVIKSYIDSLK